MEQGGREARGEGLLKDAEGRVGAHVTRLAAVVVARVVAGGGRRRPACSSPLRFKRRCLSHRRTSGWQAKASLTAAWQ